MERIKLVLKKYGSAIGATLVILVVVIWAAGAICAKRAITKTETFLRKGMGALAVETIDPYRHNVIKYDRGCGIMMGAYFQARNLERLEWAAEACLNAGKDIPDVYLALSSVRELTGRENEAVQILNSAAPRFANVPDIFYRLSQIYRRQKNNTLGGATLLRALERTPSNPMIEVDALAFFSGNNQWKEARFVAERLKNSATEDPEVKLAIARAMKRGGDPASAFAVVEQAKTMLADKPPEYKALMEKNYSDVFDFSHEPVSTRSPKSTGR